MATSFFGGSFFGGEFFSTPAADSDAPYKGGRGDGQKRATFKPTGLATRRTLRAKNADVQKRLDQSVDVAAEVAGEMARELGAERRATEQRILTAQEVDREIGILLRKKMRTEEDEIMLLLLMAAASS